MRYPLLVLTVVMLALAPAADGAAVKVKPVFAVKSASVSGKKVKFVLTVTLPPPVKCPKKTDKVTASYSASGKKIWEGSGGYTLDSDVCTAVIHGKLPKAKYNKSLKFSFKFPGNKNVKKFSGSKTLKLVTPPPPPEPGGSTPGGGDPPSTPLLVPKPGKWASIDQSGPSDGYYVFIQSDGTTSIQATGTPEWLCGPSDSISQVTVYSNWTFQTIVDSATGDYHWVDGNNDVNFHVTLHFSGPNSGSGTFSASGSYDFAAGGGVQSCHTSETFNLYGPIP